MFTFATPLIKITLLGASLMLLTACGEGREHEERTEHTEKSEHRTNPDQRKMLKMNILQRHHVLTEMRQLLASTQGVLEGIAENDMEKVAEAAALSAPKAPKTVDFRMKDVLPPDFRQMGKAAHVAFGDMAQKARNGARKEDIAMDLADTLNTCVACHSTFQVSVED